MKKKLIAVVLSLTLMVTFLLTGCSFIVKNEEREANQILATIEKYDKQLLVSQSEMMDYIQSNASGLIQNYGFTVEEAIRYLSDRKVETKLLILEGYNYLKTLNADPTSKRKAGILVSGTGTIADGVLTWGEYYNALNSVNKSMTETFIDPGVEEFKLDKKKDEISKASTKDVEKIEIVEGMEKEYLKGDELDTDALRIKVTYMRDSAGNAAYDDIIIPVTDAMITTAFDSAEVGKDKKLVITFTASNKNKDGEYEAVDKTAEYTYEIKVAPTTRTKTEDEKEDTVIERYGDKTLIAAGYDDKVLPEWWNVEAKIAATSDGERRGYTELRGNLNRAFRTMDYFYNNALENEILAALQWELQQVELAKKDDAYWNAEVGAQFAYLSGVSMISYDAMSAKDQKNAFIAAIGTALTSLYYIPKVYDKNGIENIEDYAWVSQILFSFTDEQKAELGANPTDAAYANMLLHMKVDEANPEYEPNHKHDDECEEGCNKDIAYLNRDLPVFNDGTKDADGKTILSVYSRLCKELSTATTEKDKLRIFEDYLYRFNSDGGVFNNDLGYLITPEGEETSFVKGFIDLGRKMVKESKDSNGLPQAGFYHDLDERGDYKTINVDGTDVAKVAYCYSTYGVHLMMVKFTPFNVIKANPNDYLVNNNKGYALKIDTLLTDGKHLKEYEESKTTFKKTIETSLKNELKTKAYSDFVEKYITDENKEGADTKISVNEKKLEALIKKYMQ